jgi:hypothetical protein
VPNPNIIIQSPTSLLLKWSPPFLWLGYHIDYFVVSTINKTDNHLVTVDRINASFNDAILTLNKSLNDEYVEDCNEFTFSISAFSDIYGVHPQVFNVTGGFPSGEKLYINYYVYMMLTTFRYYRIIISEYQCIFQF